MGGAVNKTIIVLALLIMSVSFASASEKEKENEKNKIAFGGFGAPSSSKFTSFGGSNPFSKDADFAYLMGVRGGFLLENFSFGGAFYTVMNKISYKCEKTGDKYSEEPDSDGWGSDACVKYKDPDILFYYGGVFLGYNLQASDFLKIELSNLFGLGLLRASGDGFFDNHYRQSFFVVEPEISALFVVKKFFAINLSFSYRACRMLADNRYDYYSFQEISAPAIGLDLRFGYFKFKKSD